MNYIDVNQCIDEFNSLRYHLSNVEKGQKELGEGQKESRGKIDRLIEETHKMFGERIDKLMEDFDKWWLEFIRMRNNDKDEVSIINDHTERIDQLTERVDALSMQPLVHWRSPPSPNLLNTSYQKYQDNMGCLNKIKINTPKYDRLDDRKAITWVNKIEGILAMNPPANELEKKCMASL